MGEQYGYEDEGNEYDDGADSGPSALRAALKAAQKELKGAKAELKTQAEQLDTFLKQSRGSSLADLLKAKGVDPKVSSLIPASVETTEDAVNQWLEQFADVFNIRTAESGTDSGREAAAPLEEETDPGAQALASAWAAVQAATQGATSSDVSRLGADAIAKIGDSNLTFDEAKRELGKIPGFRVGSHTG